MAIINAASYDDKVLQDYDVMMVEATIKVDQFSPLAFRIWAEVLRELGSRKLVTLTSGSFDDIGSALITRNY